MRSKHTNPYLVQQPCRVLLVGLLLWSVSLAASALATAPSATAALSAFFGAGAEADSALGVLIVSRVAFGLFSAVAMPAVSAMAAEWVPQRSRASAIAGVYTMFNIGRGCRCTHTIAGRGLHHVQHW